MDFGDFVQGSPSSDLDQTRSELFVSLLRDGAPGAAPAGALGDRSNWTFAALNVGFWNLAGFLGLAIPVASFVESVKQTPVRQPDNSWVWKYSITVHAITYTAELHGKYINSGVRWDMYITKQNEYTDFLWYYGESDSGSTQGYWILKNKPSDPKDLLRMDWHRNPADDTGDIKYTNIVPGGLDNGGYIWFRVTRDDVRNRSYTIFNKARNETTYIEWNSTTRAGRVKDTVHFGNGDWHCWDSSLKDTVCP
jgi:hypothetical protein